MDKKLGKDKRVYKGEFSNGDGKKLCYLMIHMFRELLPKSRDGQQLEKHESQHEF